MDGVHTHGPPYSYPDPPPPFRPTDQDRSAEYPKYARRRLSRPTLQSSNKSTTSSISIGSSIAVSSSTNPSLSPDPSPMAIPNNRSYLAHIPPPLPPPSHPLALETSPPFQWETIGWSGSPRDARHSTNRLPSISGTLARRDDPDESTRHLPDSRRESSATIRPTSPTGFERPSSFRDLDEAYGTLSSVSPSSTGQRNGSIKNPLSEYDRSLISKLDPGKRRSPPKDHLRPLITNHSALAGSRAYGLSREENQLKPLSATDSAISSWASSPGTSSPLFSSASRYGSMDVRSETESMPSSYADSDFSARHRMDSLRTPTSSSFDEPLSAASRAARGNPDPTLFEQEGDFRDVSENRFKKLVLRDKSPRHDWSASSASSVSLKRRARSPPPESGERTAVSGATAAASPPATAAAGLADARDSFGRRSSASAARVPFSHRMHPNHSSISSSSSIPRSASYVSTSSLSLPDGSTTSFSSYDRSPGALSPTAESIDVDMHYGGSSSLDPSPRGSISRAPVANHISDMNSKLLPSTNLVGKQHRQGPGKSASSFSCECCPKKPRTFGTREELFQHEAEKQYICAYCNNRFKNKNEAERHQNSLHLRKHSWSCSALTNIEAAFQTPPTSLSAPPESNSPKSGVSNNTASQPARKTLELNATCGYCGLVMPNNPPDWKARQEHLIRAHKYNECNMSKKFFRADHFRQHLKHSHAGSSGKWTNLLETACCRDEECPERKEPVKLVSIGSLDRDRIAEADIIKEE